MKSKLTIDKYDTKRWKLRNGERHREDNPVVVRNGYKYWWLNNIYYTEQQYKYETRSITTSKTF